MAAPRPKRALEAYDELDVILRSIPDSELERMCKKVKLEPTSVAAVLPAEILQKIFDYCYWGTVVRMCGLVCKHWRRTALTMPFRSRGGWYVAIRVYLNRTFSIKIGFQGARLRDYEFHYRTADYSLVERVLRQVPTSHIRIETDATRLQFGPHFGRLLDEFMIPSLKRLTLPISETSLRLVQQLPSLVYLVLNTSASALDGLPVPYQLQFLPSTLKFLEFHFPADYSCHEFATILRQCPKLRGLCLYGDFCSITEQIDTDPHYFDLPDGRREPCIDAMIKMFERRGTKKEHSFLSLIFRNIANVCKSLASSPIVFGKAIDLLTNHATACDFIYSNSVVRISHIYGSYAMMRGYFFPPYHTY